MSPILFFYLADVAPRIGAMSFTACILGAISGIIIYIFYLFSKVDEEEVASTVLGKSLKIIAIVTGIALFLSAVIPEKKTFYLMAGSSVIISVAQNDKVQSLASNSLQLIEAKIKEYTDEAKAKDEK